MKFELGSQRYFEECVQALQESELGRQYFSGAGSAEYAVSEGLDAGTLYVTLADEDFQGFLFYLPKGAFHSFPYIHLIVTKASARGKGVGAFMLDSVEKMTKSSKIFLVVSDFNPRAKQFYEKHGYMQVGMINDLYRPGIAENLMMKEIRSE